MRQTRNRARQSNAEPLAPELPAPTKRKRASKGPSNAGAMASDTNVTPLPGRSTKQSALVSLLPRQQLTTDEQPVSRAPSLSPAIQTMLRATDAEWDEMPVISRGPNHGLPQMTVNDWLRQQQLRNKGTPTTHEITKKFPILMQKLQLTFQDFEEIYGHVILAQTQYDHEHEEDDGSPESDSDDRNSDGDSSGNHHVGDRLSTEVTTGTMPPPSAVAHPPTADTITTDAITTNAESTTPAILPAFANTPQQSRNKSPDFATNSFEDPAPCSSDSQPATSSVPVATRHKLPQSLNSHISPGTASFPAASDMSMVRKTPLQSFLKPSVPTDVEWRFLPRTAAHLEPGGPKITLLEWIERQQTLYSGTPSTDELKERFPFLIRPGQIKQFQLEKLWDHVCKYQLRHMHKNAYSGSGRGGANGRGGNEDEADDEDDERRAITSTLKRGPPKPTDTVSATGLSVNKRRKGRPRVQNTPDDSDVVMTGTKDLTDPTPDGTGEDGEGRVRKDEAVKDGVQMHEAEAIVGKGFKIDLNKPDRDKVRETLFPWLGTKKNEIDIKAYQTVIDYAMGVVGLDGVRYPRVYGLAVDYLKSTNVFDAKVWSDWAGAKRINREARRLNQVSKRYPHYVITLAPDIVLCLVGAIALVPQAFAEPKGKGIDIINIYKVFHHLVSSIQIGEKVHWEKNTTGQLLLVGRRPEDEPMPAGLDLPANDGVAMQRRRNLPVAVKTPVPPSVLTSNQRTIGMDPYPDAEAFTRAMTAAEWEARNKTWLDDILEPANTKETLGETFHREVNSQTMPLIGRARRNVLRRWAQAENIEIDDELFQIPPADTVQVPVVPQLDNRRAETDEARRTLRQLEGMVLGLPAEMSEVSRQMKQCINRLFAMRDHEISNFKMMLNFQNSVMPTVSTDSV
ncbi:uncharacterized protein QYS62_004023 [Fusarium acuminatum]|uniref:Transcription factor n=1 Tax=Fusarium acuminatum TaxID=5515 RepID=A0ABZ2WQL0_9HYPO